MQKGGIFPSSDNVSGISKVGSEPVVSGGFADVYKGQVGGSLVALKVLRFLRRVEDSTAAFNVGSNFVNGC